ncbi:hypothetical protein GCM10010278_79000 [Streptomyces melanogenes]|nr:hypothetical protein GCM10010278_79000 [Streptomyces melanogenes]
METSISAPMIFMNGAELGMKKNTTDEPMPSIGRSCISIDSCCPRGSSGGASSRSSSEDTSGGKDRGGRLTTIWLTGASIPQYGRSLAFRRPLTARFGGFLRATVILLAACDTGAR